jgi:hypothetical protein
VPPSPLTLAATERLRRLAGQDPDPAHLAAALRHLGKWRSELVGNTISAQTQDRVVAGPFRRMLCGLSAGEGARAGLTPWLWMGAQ